MSDEQDGLELTKDDDGWEDVVLPASLAFVSIPLGMTFTTATRNKKTKELAITYELDLETLPAFDEPATKVMCEVRMPLEYEAGQLKDAAWVAEAEEHIRHCATRDLQEALGIFLWHTRSEITSKAAAVCAELDPGDYKSAKANELFAAEVKRVGPLVSQCRVVPMGPPKESRAAAWLRQPGNLLTVLLVLAGVVTAAWLVLQR